MITYVLMVKEDRENRLHHIVGNQHQRRWYHNDIHKGLNQEVPDEFHNIYENHVGDKPQERWAWMNSCNR